MRTDVSDRSPAARHPRRGLLGLLGALVLALPVVPAAAAEPATSAAEQGEAPSVHYEEALAHAADRIEFEPGGRVTVGFRPRPGDRWTVGGRAPRGLPAGRASGRAIAASPQGSLSAADKAPADPLPVDQPTVDPAGVVEADPASVVTASDAPPIPQATASLRREVFGFLPYWELSASSTTLNYDLLSTIAYFGVGVENDGDLLKRNADGTITTGWGGWTSSKLTSVINAAHTKGTRVVLTLQKFAWSSSQASAQAALLGNATARANLARQAAAAVRDRGADGINLDFEPIASGYADEFTLLVRQVRAELDAIQTGYQLTFDTTGYIGNYPLEDATAPGGADAVFVMGYDYRTAGSTYAGSISPVAGSIYDLTDTIQAYTARVPASKLILGVPYYGRDWATTSDALNARNQSGAKFGSSATVVYANAVAKAATHGRRYDSVEQAPWYAYRKQNCTTTYGCVTTWREAYYDDPTSLGAKYDLINRKDLRGAGIWALGYDDARPELYGVLAGRFVDDRTAPVAGIVRLAPTQASESFAVSWAARDDWTGVASYDLQVSVAGGPWSDWLRGTTATSGTYLGANGHPVAFRVRARDGRANVGPWTVSNPSSVAVSSLAVGGFAQVTTDGLNVRSAPGTGAPRVAGLDSGAIVAITGGPVSADGYTWYEVTAPVTEWGPVSDVQVAVWVAAGGGGETFLVPTAPPNSTRVQLPSGTTPAAGGRYVPLPGAVRLLSSKSGGGLSGPFVSGTTRSFQVAGRGGIPAGAVAVTGNLVVLDQTSSGSVSLGPTGSSLAGTLWFPKGDRRSSGVTIGLGPAGTLDARFAGSAGSRAHLVFDATGYFVAGSGAGYQPVSPTRVLSTSSGKGLSGTFSSGRPRSFQVAGRNGIPTSAIAVTGNVIVHGQTSSGRLALGPAVTTKSPPIMYVRYGDRRSNGVTIRLGTGGRLSAAFVGSSGSRTHLIFDVTGYFVSGPGGATFHPIAPVRLLNSAIGWGVSGAFASSKPKSFQTAGRGTIPSDALAVTGSLMANRPTSTGRVAIGSAVSTSSPAALYVARGDRRANGVTVRFAAYGRQQAIFAGTTRTSTQLILDATGYYR